MNEKSLKTTLYVLFILALITVIVYFGIGAFQKLNGSKSNNPVSSLQSDLTPEQLKADLIDKKLFYWETPIQSTQIPDCRILGKSEIDDCIVFNVALKLNDGNKNEPTYFLGMKYNEQGLVSITTQHIVYNNPIVYNDASEYKFIPLKDCKIFINTKGEEIQLKTCPDCLWASYKVGEDDSKEIPQSDYISISSKNNLVKNVEFTYVPLNVQETIISNKE
jgi:hypothetical protein